VALDTSAAKTRLRALAEAGVAIVIDDFGVGYSSLASLRGEHVRQVKIDRSFMLNLASSPGSRLMVEAVIRLGQSLFIEVVAEGVENREELEALNALGSPLLQGYYFMRPAPLDKVIAWAAQREGRIRGAGLKPCRPTWAQTLRLTRRPGSGQVQATTTCSHALRSAAMPGRSRALASVTTTPMSAARA
jgi:predicted signal transduction protein with EAL and GGDEF domain